MPRVLLLLSLLSLAPIACRAPAASLAPIVVASDLDNAPFAWVDEEGLPRGRDVEMMELLAAELGRTIEWKRMPFDQLLEECEAGRVDVVCATLGITVERERRVDFTRPYFETNIAVVVRRGPGEPRSLAELGGRRVAAGVGTTSQFAVERHLPNANLASESKAERTTAERLASKEVDAAVMDGPAANALVASSGQTLQRLEEALASESYALCLPKERRQLTRRLDDALESLHREGVLATLNARHGLTSAAR